MTDLIHIAGPDVTIHAGDRDLLRQRCSWCGATLADYDLARIAVPEGQPGQPATWPVGALVAVDGNASWVEELDDGRLPERCCALLDPAATQ